MKLLVLLASVCSFCMGYSTVTPSQYSQGITGGDELPDRASCSATMITPKYVGRSDSLWRGKIQASAQTVSRILASEEFFTKCRSLRLSRTNGKSVDEVCRQLACSGKIIPAISFYHDPDSRFIAYASGGTLFINTAKTTAGSPGNLAHEVAHTLGYSHFSNRRLFGMSSVPYRIGDLVTKLVNALDR